MLWIALTGKNVWMCDYCLRRNVPIWAHYDEKVRPSIRQHTLKWRQELLSNAICIKIEWRTKHLLVDKLKSIVEVVCCSAWYESTVGERKCFYRNNHIPGTRKLKKEELCEPILTYVLIQLDLVQLHLRQCDVGKGLPKNRDPSSILVQG